MTTTTILSDNGVSSGSAGIKTTGGNDGTLQLQTTTSGGTATTAVTIGTNQSVTFAQAANLPNTFGFKNRIINGAMGIWQRGTSGFTTNNNYSADRWMISASTSLSAVGQSTDVPAGYKYSLSVNGTNYPNMQQRIESVNCTDLVGQSVTVSFWAKQSVGAGTNSLYFNLGYANLGVDNWNSTTLIGSGNVIVNGSTSWTQYSATFTNLPAGAANGLEVTVGSYGAGASTFLVTGVQLEKGSTATSFDYRPYGTELALCQRYCPVWDFPASSGSVVGLSYASTVASHSLPNLVQTRVPVTGITTSGSFVTTNGAGTPISATVSFAGASNFVINLTATVASGLTAGQAGILYATTAAKIIGNGAEL